MGTRDIDRLVNLSNYGNALFSLGNAEEAFKICKQYAMLGLKTIGKNDIKYDTIITSITSIALIQFQIGLHFEKSLYLLQKCKLLILRKYSPRHPLYLQIASRIAGIYIIQRKYEKARKFLRCYPSYDRLLRRSEDFAFRYNFVRSAHYGYKVAKSFVDYN